MGAVYRSLEPVDLEGGKLEEPIPLGPEGVLHGQLDCGLTYYVRQCSKPKGRAALALVVRVGSLAEEEAERGLAHVVEHLAFSATENYENHAIVAFLESIGAAFGACSNAYTSADETVFHLMVRTDDPDRAQLDRSLGVLSEFAARVRCSASDLAKERGAVMEELRQAGNNSAGRLQQAHWAALMAGCRYAERLPIGLESVIRGAPAATVAAFYRKWYQPENMAVVVVGDFPDCQGVVDVITKHLATAWAGREQQPAPQLPVVLPEHWQHSEPRFRAYVDREAPDPALYVSWKVAARPTATPAQYLEVLKDSLFMSCLNTRLYRLTRGTSPPFFSASLSDEPTCRVIDLLVLAAECEEGRVLRALEALLVEVARARAHGFSRRELETALKGMQADVEQTWLEADQGYCTDLRDEYVRHFLGGEFVSGQRFEARLNKTLLPLISLADVNARAQALSHTSSCLIKAVEHRARTSEAAMRAVVLKVAADEAAGRIGPWQEPEAPEPLLEQIPAVPDEWYTACGQQPPASPEEELAEAQQAAATAAAAAAAAAGRASSPADVLHTGDGGLGSGSLSRNHSLQHSRHAHHAAAGGAHTGCGGSCAAAHGGDEQQQQQADEQQQQQQQQQAEVVAVPREPLTMLYPGVVSEASFPQLGVRQLTLANGLRVALKATDFFADEVLVTALALGGLSEVPRAGFYTASMAGVVASQLGWFGRRPEALAEVLAGRRVSLSPSEGAYSRSVKGSASPHDLETMAQLLHLLFTRPPTLDPAELEPVMVQVRQGIEAQLRSPLHRYHARLRAVCYSCYFFEPISLEELDKVDLAAACAHHAASYSDPSEFTLVLTGNTSLAALLPLITRYLATIPAAPGRGGRRDARSLTPLPFGFPAEPVDEDVAVDMVSPITQCQVTLPVTLDRPVAREHLWWLQAACKVLETRLLQKLRFELGDLYTVSVQSFFGCEAASSTEPQLRGDVSIAWTCAPENKARLVALALDTLERLQEEGPTQAEVDTVVKLDTFEWEQLLEENSFWHDVVVNAYQSRRYADTGGDLDAVWATIRDSRAKVLAEMSCGALRDQLRARFPYPARRRYAAVTMMPKPPGLWGRCAFRFLAAPPAVQWAVVGGGAVLLAAGVVAGALMVRHRCVMARRGGS